MKTTLLALALLGLVGCSAEADDAEPESNDDAISAVTPLDPEPAGSPAHYPIVLAHGFLGAEGGFANFNPRISEALGRDGHAVFPATLPPFGTVHQRALVLSRDVDRILRETGARKVNLVAHSMGGLDARELVSTLGYGDRVASITTISTPHHGSRIADVGLALADGVPKDALEAIATLLGKAYGDIADDSDLRGALFDMSEKNSAAWNAAHPDDPRVYYQSWAGVSSFLAIPNPADADACDGKLVAHQNRADMMGAVLVPAAPFVAHGLHSNDGFVLVSSAKWGNFRGCVPADHADEIGVFRSDTMDSHTGYDFVRFHRNLAFDLATRGF
jgi:triacylglycerol lipase